MCQPDRHDLFKKTRIALLWLEMMVGQKKQFEESAILREDAVRDFEDFRKSRDEWVSR